MKTDEDYVEGDCNDNDDDDDEDDDDDDDDDNDDNKDHNDDYKLAILTLTMPTMQKR